MRVILYIIIAFVALTARAQQPPITLTDTERQQWAQFGEIEKGLMASLQSTAPLARTLTASNEKDAIRYLSAMKEIYSAIDTNVLQRALLLEQMRGKYKCEGCVVSDGVLTKPKEIAGAGK